MNDDVIAIEEPERIRALLFDLGGVILDIDFNRAFEVWASCTGIEARAIRERFVMDLSYQRLERGELAAASYLRSLEPLLGCSLPDAEWLAGWNALLGEPVPGIEDLLKRAAGSHPLYLFSNTNAVHQAVWQQRCAHFMHQFRQVFVSCEMGLRKPESMAFRHVAQTIGVDCREILFFDDVWQNIAAARRLGMATVWVRSIDDIHSALQRVLRTDR